LPGSEAGAAHVCAARQFPNKQHMKNMKTVSKLILLASLIVAPVALKAWTLDGAYIASYHGRTDIPVPVKVIAPHVGSEYAGTTIKLAFVVDTAGVPRNITVPASVPADLAETLVAAISGWRFQPMIRDGKSVPSKVVLPVNIVSDLDEAPKVAVN
jgi:Gram-negative bacterial TonB protein C-terminal